MSDSFARSVQAYCDWAISSTKNTDPNQELERAFQLVADLVAGCSALGWSEGVPSERDPDPSGLELVKAKVKELPLQYYSEIYSNLIVPPEEPVVGDLMDDLLDIYSDLSPGLVLYNSNEKEEALAHWKFWFTVHWGEHATSAIRAMWSYLSKMEASDVESAT